MLDRLSPVFSPVFLRGWDIEYSSYFVGSQESDSAIVVGFRTHPPQSFLSHVEARCRRADTVASSGGVLRAGADGANTYVRHGAWHLGIDGASQNGFCTASHTASPPRIGMEINKGERGTHLEERSSWHRYGTHAEFMRMEIWFP